MISFIKRTILLTAGLGCDRIGTARIVAAIYRIMRQLFGYCIAEKFRWSVVAFLNYPFTKIAKLKKINFHGYGFSLRLQRMLSPFEKKAKKTPNISHKPRRIGIVGNAVSSGYQHLCISHIDDHQLFIFDTAPSWITVDYEEDVGFYKKFNLGDSYWEVAKNLPLAPEYREGIESLSNEICSKELDILYIMMPPEASGDIVDLIDVPCIVDIAYGPVFLCHSKVDYALHTVEYAFFPVKDNQVTSFFTGQSVPFSRCCTDGFFPYPIQRRSELIPTWDEREPLILWYGALDKLNYPCFLSLIANLLRDDSNLTFQFIGSGNCLDEILNVFERAGVVEQIEYRGSVDVHEHRIGGGTIINELLASARLAPSPFPMGGGVARVEAYIAGAPTVHMRHSSNVNNPWDIGEMPVTDLPSLEVSMSTAHSVEEYEKLCKRCLYDKNFANIVSMEQIKIIDKIGDMARWWENANTIYSHWLEGAGWAHRFGPVGGRIASGKRETATC